MGNTVLNQTILLPYPSTIQQEAGGALQQQEIAAQANLQATQRNLQAAQDNLELKERENQQVCQRLLHYDNYIKFQLMHLLINANTDILYPRIQQMGQGQQVVPLAEQQVRGNANQENNGNQQNHINQENQGENGQVPVVNEQVEVQAEPQVQERRRPRGGLERMGDANGLRGNQVGGRNGNNRGNGIVGIND